MEIFYFYSNAIRNIIVIIVFTAISWDITRAETKAERKISILGTVPSGLKEVGIFKVPEGLLVKVAPELPPSVIILLLEHIAISKSFGRVNDYKVLPYQELIAIGVTNLVGTFFSAYPATGSFSRSALKAKCNVKTLFSGLFSGACVLLALYCLTGAFFYIPKATLSAVIIHAVTDLIASYKTTWNFWKMNALDCFCFVVTIFITVFSSIETGIYFPMCWSCAVLLFKIAFPAGKSLGGIQIAEVLNDEVTNNDYVALKKVSSSVNFTQEDKNKKNVLFTPVPTRNNNIKYHTEWLPFDHTYTKELNPNVKVLVPPPGVLVYRMSESFTYLNCSKNYDVLYDGIKRVTRSGNLNKYLSKSDRLWNDPGKWEPPTFMKDIKKIFKKKNKASNLEEADGIYFSREDDDNRPILRIICLDFSQVAQIDATALKSLVDLRRAINIYADR